MKCRTPQELETYVQSLNQNWKGPVEILPYKPKRSPDQNSLLWVRHGWTADRLNELQSEMLAQMGYGCPKDGDAQEYAATLQALRNPWTKDAVHNLIFKPRFCHGESSTRMTKMEMVDAMNEYEVWQAEIGVVFPEQEYE